jgi:hypothetical protein
MITPKEKALELICKMYGCETNTDLDTIFIINADGYFIAKDSALIAVEELIQQQEGYNNGSFYPNDYWKQVKQEIELL